MDNNDNWIVVTNNKRKKFDVNNDEGSKKLNFNTEINKDEVLSEIKKIISPCWFFNNGGCKHKDGTEKKADECKYLHIISENLTRPPHLSIKKPCDKFNLEGECKWGDDCKYSHRILTPEEWELTYPTIPFNIKKNMQKKAQFDNKLLDIEARLKILEFKQEGIVKDLQEFIQLFQEFIEEFKSTNIQFKTG